MNQKYKIVFSPDGDFLIKDNRGHFVARFPCNCQKEAQMFARVPELIASLAKILDGAEGYFSEVGEEQKYWQEGDLDDARKLLDEIEPIISDFDKR